MRWWLLVHLPPQVATASCSSAPLGSETPSSLRTSFRCCFSSAFPSHRSSRSYKIAHVETRTEQRKHEKKITAPRVSGRGQSREEDEENRQGRRRRERKGGGAEMPCLLYRRPKHIYVRHEQCADKIVLKASSHHLPPPPNLRCQVKEQRLYGREAL